MNKLLKEIERLNKKRNIKAKKAKKIVDTVEKKLKKIGLDPFSIKVTIPSEIRRAEDNNIYFTRIILSLCDSKISARKTLYKEVVEQVYKERRDSYFYSTTKFKNRYFIEEYYSRNCDPSWDKKEEKILILKNINILLEATIEELKKREEEHEDQD
jgi:hypothetical protein